MGMVLKCPLHQWQDRVFPWSLAETMGSGRQWSEKETPPTEPID